MDRNETFWFIVAVACGAILGNFLYDLVVFLAK